MNIFENLQKNEKGNIIMSRANVSLLMIYVMENKISNVGHFISKDLNLNISGYNSVVRKFKTEFPVFYNYYNYILENSKLQTKERIKDALLYIGLLMKNGIELEDGTFRQFDLFDWFIIKNKYFDNLCRQEITKILDEFNYDSAMYCENINLFELRKFISRAYGDSLQNYSMPIYEDYEYKNVRNLITKEEYDNLIQFMKLHNIPLSKRNFDFGVDKIRAQRNNPNNLFEINNNIEHNKTLGQLQK